VEELEVWKLKNGGGRLTMEDFEINQKKRKKKAKKMVLKSLDFSFGQFTKMPSLNFKNYLCVLKRNYVN